MSVVGRQSSDHKAIDEERRRVEGEDRSDPDTRDQQSRHRRSYGPCDVDVDRIELGRGGDLGRGDELGDERLVGGRDQD